MHFESKNSKVKNKTLLAGNKATEYFEDHTIKEGMKKKAWNRHLICPRS